MRRTVFIHIPRTAGRAIWATAQKASPSFQSIRSRSATVWNPEIDFTHLGHRSPGSLMDRGIITKRWWDDCFKFAFVRNPWDRLVSLYRYLSSFRPMSSYSFERFVRQVAPGKIQSIGQYSARRFSQANRQTDWLQWGVDFVGRYEQLNEDWKELCDLIDVKHFPLTERFWKDSGDYHLHYTDETADLVGEFYAAEIERFGYSF